MGSYKGLSPCSGSEATLTAINCGRVMAPATRGITLRCLGSGGRSSDCYRGYGYGREVS